MVKEKYRVAIVGATGMVGQRLIAALADHPWLEIAALAASGASSGKPYEQIMQDRWCMDFAIPDKLGKLILKDAERIDHVVTDVDIVFSAVSAKKEDVLRLEHAYASKGAWVTSCNSAYRDDPLVPMMIPAVNASHLRIIPVQRQSKHYKNGAIIVKSNCSLQSYVIALEPLRQFGIKRINVHSEQAISGAGKTFSTYPEMVNNLVPFIEGEERKSEVEPLKIWGQISNNRIEPADRPVIRAKCVRVAVQDGHTAYVHATFEKGTPAPEEILSLWKNFKACQGLPSAPKQFIHYLPQPDRPQPRLDVMTENGMAVSVGQLQVNEDGLRFTALSHNAVLGAAGGAVLATELAIHENLIKHNALAVC